MMNMSEKTPRLFVHKKRPEWGIGLLLQDTPDQWTLAFEDGQQRRLARAHPLLEPHASSPAETAAIIAKLTPKKKSGSAKSAGGSGARKTKKGGATFAQQVKAFQRKFPGGFADPKYLVETGGTERGEHRHNDAAIEDAKISLGSEALGALIDAGGFETVHRIAARLMSASRNLVVRFDVARFSGMSVSAYPRFAQALQELLHGSGREEDRWDAYVRSLKTERAPTWPMVTVLPALHFPEAKVYVRPSFFRRQAAVLGRVVPEEQIPSGRGYMQFRDLALNVRDELVACGQTPNDMWDVYRFVWLTMSPRSDASVS
jgi:hypothetical protein